MTIISSLPVNITNGTLEDATQVMANFNWIVSQVNANAVGPGANSTITSLSGLTTALSVSQGGTGSGIAATGLSNLGGLAIANNLSDLNNVVAARTNLGLGSAALLTAGTAANNAVQLDAGARLPAIDGSQLTNVAIPKQQTVLSGPVDTNGYAAFGGSTGASTVTATGTLLVTAAAGPNANFTQSITNPSWTGLTTTGTMYLYVDISGGVISTGSTTLAPSYQWGGAYSTVSGQHTFNIQEMTMKAGNGTTATQVYRVFVGEVTVAAGVTTSITWYALMGRFKVTQGTVAASTAYTFNHNIGCIPMLSRLWAIFKTATDGYAIGNRIECLSYADTASRGAVHAVLDSKTSAVVTGVGFSYFSLTTGGVINGAWTNASFEAYLERGW